MRHGRFWHLLVRHQGPATDSARDRIRKPGYEDGRQHGGLDSGVVVRIDADVFLLRRKRIFAARFGLEFVVRLKVRPTPDSAVNDVRQAFSVRHLEPAVQTAGDRYALRFLARAGQSSFQVFDCTLFLLELFDKSVDSFFSPLFFFVALFPS